MVHHDEGDLFNSLLLQGGFDQIHKRGGDHGHRGDPFLFQVQLVNYQPRGADPSVRLARNDQIGFQTGNLSRYLFAYFPLLGNNGRAGIHLPHFDDFHPANPLGEQFTDAVKKLVPIVFPVPAQQNFFPFQTDGVGIDLDGSNPGNLPVAGCPGWGR
jgi:hypothetical protein